MAGFWDRLQRDTADSLEALAHVTGNAGKPQGMTRDTIYRNYPDFLGTPMSYVTDMGLGAVLGADTLARGASSAIAQGIGARTDEVYGMPEAFLGGYSIVDDLFRAANRSARHAAGATRNAMTPDLPEIFYDETLALPNLSPEPVSGLADTMSGRPNWVNKGAGGI